MKKFIEITKAPQNFEVVGQNKGYADIEACGIFIEDDNDDTEQLLEFSKENVFLSVVREDDGSFATHLTPLKSDGDEFHCVLKNVPCGGPYMIDVVYLNDENGICYPLRGEKPRHFFVGDVYIIAGQSNAAGMGRGFIEDSPEMGISVLRNLEKWDIASAPFNDFDYSKHNMFISFAKKIRRETACPVGLVPAAMGGAPLSRWLKEENGDLYNKMISSVKSNGVKAKAVLWYQGCADAGEGRETKEYLNRFASFVRHIRKDLKNENLPVFTFQLNRQQTVNINESLGIRYDKIREAQRLAAKTLKNVYILPAIDCTIMSDFIHSGKPSNMMLGQRLAMQVLQKLYHIGTGADAPEIIKAVLIGKTKIELSFSNVTEFLYAFNSNNENFPIKIYDEDGRVQIKEFTIKKDKIYINTIRECRGNLYICGQSGTNPEKIIMDFGTQIPMLCFNNFYVEG